MTEYTQRHLYEQRPYFEEMACYLRGVDKRKKINNNKSYQCVCPSCGKKESWMFASEKGDTFLFHCFRDTCNLKTLTLHQLITLHGDVSIQKRWLKKADDWLPIRNRITPGPKRNKSFKEKMQLKSECQRVRILGEMESNKRPTSTPSQPSSDTSA